MKSQNSEKHNVARVNRRSVLAATAGLIAGGMSTVQSAGAQLTDQPDINKFYVEGQKLTRVQIERDQVVIHTRKMSPDLHERYGSSVLETRETIERPEPEEDELPDQEMIVERETWSGYVANEEEWVELANSDNSSQIMMSAQESGELETHLSYPSGLPKYYHNNDDGRWVLSGPINLLGSFLYDADDCASTIADNGDGSLWTTSVADATRYALVDGEYRPQDASVASGPLGLAGRTHARLWDTGGRILIAAHEDDWVPHSAESYLEAEYRIVDFMDSSKDRYDAGNDEHFTAGQMLDHNGEVSYLWSM